MWSEYFKRWMDAFFWWLPRDDQQRQAERKPEVRDRQPRSDKPPPRQPQATREPDPVPPAAASPEQAPVETPAAAPDAADDLTVIKGIGAAMQDKLQAIGIRTYADLAGADPEKLLSDLRAAQAVASRARIQEWIATAREKQSGH